MSKSEFMEEVRTGEKFGSHQVRQVMFDKIP